MRELTTPIIEEQATHQYVSDGQYHIAINDDNTINIADCYYAFKVTSTPSGNHQWRRVMAPDMPAAFRAKLKELHQMVNAYAENQGMIGAGTDTDDL